MTDVYIIRHAESEGNLYRRIHGHYNGTVTETGLLQIDCLERRLEALDFEAVYSSDLYRAQSTARAAWRPKGLELVTTERLREVNMGVWEDQTWGDIALEDPEQLKSFTFDPAGWHIPGAEAHEAVAERMWEAVRDLAARHSGGAIALVSHGSAIRTLLARIMGVSSADITDVGMSDNTAVTHLRVDGDKMDIIYRNDNQHLKAGMSILEKQNWHKRETGGRDSTSLRFAPMDLRTERDRYLTYRRDGWRAVHQTMSGYSDGFLDLALGHMEAEPWSVVEVFLGDESVGLLELAPKSGEREGWGSITYFYLRGPYRNRGLGVQLIGQAVSHYRPRGRGRLRLHVAQENDVARRFYARYGFQPIGETQGSLGQLYILEKDIEQKVR